MKSCKAELRILLVVLLAALFEVTTEAVQCKDEGNNAVDWFIMYKLPSGASTTTTSPIPKGYQFYSMDSNSPRWTISTTGIDQQGQPLYETIQQVYDQTFTGMHLMYNDQKPILRNINFAHAKGVVAFDTNTGFWLIHSAPKFPKPKTNNVKYEYPSSASTYGQMFLCVSFPTTDPSNRNIVNLEIIARQLRVNKVQIYDENVPQALQYPEVQRLINKTPITVQNHYNIADLTSIGGKTFKSFAKQSAFGKELYADLVAPNLRSDLLVQTWRRGSTLGPPIPNQYQVYDVDYVKLPSQRNTVHSFKMTLDHSKFAVSAFSPRNWVCIGDINRMDSQRTRGGGTLCFQETSVADAFRNALICANCPISPPPG